MSLNKKLYQKAVTAINDLYSDLSVSRKEAFDNLNSLIEEIEIMKECLENDGNIED